MAGETVITFIGNLTDDPELRFTPSGAAVANFTVVNNARKFNKNSNEWEDQPPTFLRCAIWRQEAENVAESLTKGTRVILQGALKCRPWETKEGEKRQSWELDVYEIGPSLKWATANVTRTRQNSGSSSGGGQQSSGSQQGAQSGGNDPWAAPGNQTNDPWAAPSQGEEPPF